MASQPGEQHLGSAQQGMKSAIAAINEIATRCAALNLDAIQANESRELVGAPYTIIRAE